jgi:hypothetical protein
MMKKLPKVFNNTIVITTLENGGVGAIKTIP